MARFDMDRMLTEARSRSFSTIVDAVEAARLDAIADLRMQIRDVISEASRDPDIDGVAFPGRAADAVMGLFFEPNGSQRLPRPRL